MTVQSPAPEGPALQSLLICACASELELLAAACTGIENALGQAVSDPSFTPEDLVIELQDLDRVRQILNDLAPFLHGIAAPAPDTTLADLLAKLSLSDLRQRITTDTQSHLHEPPDQATKTSPLGSIDWF